MRIGIGTPNSQRRIQPTFPACCFKRVATMKSPPKHVFRSGIKAIGVPMRQVVAATGNYLFFSEMGTGWRLGHCVARAPRVTPAYSATSPAKRTHAESAIE